MEQLNSPILSPAAGAARLATSAIFFLNGFVFASWVLHIPFVREKLGLSTGVLGLALLGIAVGSLLSMPLTGNLIARLGSKKLTRLFAALNPLTLLPLLLAPNLPALVLALLIYGAVNGALDVSMNAQGVAVERRMARPILSSFHAWFSFGGLAGAGLGSLLLGAGVSPLAHVLGVAGVFFMVALFCGSPLLARSADVREDAPPAPRRRGWHPSSAMLLLGSLGFLGLLGEGAIGDWSAVYFRDELGANAALAGLGFTAFSLAMTFGRAFGDVWRAKFGDARLLGFGAAISGLGLLGALLVGSPLGAALGLAVFGVGIANIVPVLFSAAGSVGAAGQGIAQVSTLSYLGFLAGPPLIGLIAQATDLKLGLGFVAGCVLVIALLSPRALRPAARRAPA